MPQSDQSKKLQSLKDKVDRLEKDVKQLKDLLNVQDNWHSEVRSWAGEQVSVQLGAQVWRGVLRWIDRYTLSIYDGTSVLIFPKSQIVVSRVTDAGQ